MSSVSLTAKKEKIYTQAKKTAGDLSALMLGKYFFLLCVLAVMAVSVRLIGTMRSIESVLIYTSGNDITGLRPCNLFGLAGKSVHRFSDWVLVSDLLYILFVVMISAVIFLFLKRTEEKSLRISALLGCCTVIYAVSNISDDTVFSMAVSLIPVLTAYMVMFTKRGYLAPLFTAAGVVIDPRAVIIIVPLSGVVFLLQEMFDDGEKRKKAVITVLAIVSSLAVLFLSEGFFHNSTADISFAAERMSSRYENFFDGTGTEEIYVKVAIDDVTDEGAFITSTPISALKSCIGINTEFIDEIHNLGGPFLMMLVYVLLVLASGAKKLMKNSRIRLFLICSAVFDVYMLLLTGRSICVIIYLLSLFGLKLYYHKKSGETPDIKEEHFVYGCIAGAVVMRLLQLVICANPDNFPLTHYYLDYETFGFMPRLLIGSIFVKLSGGTFTASELITVMTVIEMLIVLCEAFLLLEIYRRSDDRKERYVLMMLMFIYAFSPASSTLSHLTNTLKLDWFLVAISLICIWALYKNNALIFLLPVSCIAMMLIHHVFVCTMFPVLFIMMIYRAIVEPGRHMIRNTAVMVVTLAVTATMFFWFNFMYEPPESISVEYMSSVVDIRSEGTVEPYYDLIRYVYLGRPNERAALYTMQNGFTSVKVFLLSLPLTALFVYALFLSAKRETKRIKKLTYIAVGLSLPVTLAPFFTDCDWGRWCAYYLKTILIPLVFISALQPADKKWYGICDEKKLRIFMYITLLLQSVMPSLYTTFMRFPLFAAW